MNRARIVIISGLFVVLSTGLWPWAQDAFEIEQAKVPIAIRDISIEILQTPTPDYSAFYSVQVEYSDGSVKPRTGGLIPHLTTAQRNGLQALMVDLRAKAVAEILPTP